jgi:hypothetical protein
MTASVAVAHHASTTLLALPNPPVSSRISDGHRLLRYVEQHRDALYDSRQFHRTATTLPAGQVMQRLVPALRAQISRRACDRITAAVQRAHHHAALYDVKQAGVAECIAEALCDPWSFRMRPEHLPRIQLRNRIATLMRSHRPIDLVLPVFSRKPLSPVKNHGPWPDLAELASLAQLAGAVQVASALSPNGCRIVLLADGHKYRRACQTPAAQVDGYQQALQSWISALGVQDQLVLHDYEAGLSEELLGVPPGTREATYRARAADLTATYRPALDLDDLTGTLHRLAQGDAGATALGAALSSLLTSVRYSALADQSDPDRRQNAYLHHLLHLHAPLEVAAARWQGPETPHEVRWLLESLRHEAWDAAIHYVAISDTDRRLQVLRHHWPQAIKLTIHAKPGELHCITTSRRNINMTAQHGCGGLLFGSGGAVIDVRYRIEREAEAQVPVLIGADASQHGAGPLAALHAATQPFFYTNDPEALHRDAWAEQLLRGDDA